MRLTVKQLTIRLETAEAKLAAIEAELRELKRFVPDYWRIKK